MRVLVLGGGGREHAIEMKLAQSKYCDSVITCPGNGGTNTPIKYQNLDIADFSAILRLIQEQNIDLIFIGPEVPLTMGLKDFLEKESPATVVFGPNKNQAQLEASKIFSYNIMEKCAIVQAKGAVVETMEQANKVLQNWQGKIVIKADGLAAGKGVSIHSSKEEALKICEKNLSGELFGEAGKKLLVQSFLTGTEASVFAICNGKEAIYLPGARDYKAAFDNNKGPNTGGMGSYCPSEIITDELLQFIDVSIVKPIIAQLDYRGLLYCGLMVHTEDSSPENKVSVIEFNCRLGDPETQVVMPMLETDLLPYLLWSENKEGSIIVPKLKKGNIFVVPTKPGFSLNVVLSAKGYPHDYKKSLALSLPEALSDNVSIVHAGTKVDNNNLVSNGGRIINVVATAKTKGECRELVYPVIQKIDSASNNGEESLFHYRNDIGLTNLNNK